MPRTITIGVDFGTTYSSVAYYDSRDERGEPILIKNWGRGTLSSANVPTVLWYGSSGTEWGFKAKNKDGRKECFKLALDPNVWKRYGCVDMDDMYRHWLASPPDNSNATKLCTDYLRVLRKQAWEAIMNAFKRRKQDLASVHLQWVITVPAVWDLAAQALTQQCAVDAGFQKTNLQIVSEPEAAAMYSLKNFIAKYGMNGFGL